MAQNTPLSIADHYSDKPQAYFDTARHDIAPLIPLAARRVLELGCGAGATMRMLRDKIGIDRAIGIECSPASAAQARAAFDEVIIGDAETIDLPDDAFDLILALDVLEHLRDPWHMVDRLADRLAPGGRIIVSLPNIGHFSVVYPLIRGRWNYTQDGLLDATHLRFFTETSARALMSRHGLGIRQVLINDRPRAPFRLTSQRLRWYQARVMGKLLPRNLTAFQFLIASDAPA